MSLQEAGLRRAQTIEPAATARAAAKRMEKEGIGCLVVVDGQRPVGIVTDRDIVLEVLAERRDAGLVQVGEIAARNPVTIPDTASVPDAIALLRRHGVRRLPAVDATGNLAGIVTQDDLLRLLATEIGELAEVLRRQLAESVTPRTLAS